MELKKNLKMSYYSLGYLKKLFERHSVSLYTLFKPCPKNQPKFFWDPIWVPKPPKYH